MMRSLVITTPVAIVLTIPGAATAQQLPGDGAIAQLDRAETLIAQQDAAGRPLSALLGVLTDADRSALKVAITEAAELTDAASIAIDEAVAQIDSAEDPEGALADRRFALAIERRELRLPLARARVATILAALQDDPRTRTTLATTAVNALHKVTLGSAAIDTRGSVIAGEALHLLGDHEKALASFDNAIDRASAAGENEAVSLMDLAEARLGRALALSGSQGDHAARMALSGCREHAPFAGGGSAGGLFALLLADASVSLDLAHDIRPVGIMGHLGALEATTSEGAYLAVRKAVFERLNLLWGRGAWNPAAAPTLAQAARLGDPGSDELERETALRALERALNEPDRLSDTELAEARFAVAMAHRDDDSRRAMLLLLEVAGAGDNHPLAEAALAEAYTIGDAIEHRDLADPATAVFDRVLATMIDGAQDDARLGTLWSRRAALFGRVGDHDKMIMAFDQVPDNAPGAPRVRRHTLILEMGTLVRSGGADTARSILGRVERIAGFEGDADTLMILNAAVILAQTELGRMDLAVDAIEACSPSHSPATTLALTNALTPLAAMVLDAELRADDGATLASARLLRRALDSDLAKSLPQDDSMRRAEGLALLFTGEPGSAAKVFRVLFRDDPDPDLGAWLGEALLADGDTEEAFAQFREVASSLEASGATHWGAFWRSWSRMLEILAAQPGARDGEGSGAEQIVVQINRLRLLDEGLGGQPYRRRIEAVERAMKPTGE